MIFWVSTKDVLHKRFPFEMPGGTQQRGEIWWWWWWGGRVRGRADSIKRQAARDHTPPPPSPLPTIHLSSTEQGNKSDRVQSLSLMCQWGEWVRMRLSDRPAVVGLPCQPYWIMTWQEVACYEPCGATGRYHRRGFRMSQRGRKVAEMKPVWT